MPLTGNANYAAAVYVDEYVWNVPSQSTPRQSIALPTIQNGANVRRIDL
jgi:hypothetical protein